MHEGVGAGDAVARDRPRSWTGSAPSWAQEEAASQASPGGAAAGLGIVLDPHAEAEPARRGAEDAVAGRGRRRGSSPAPRRGRRARATAWPWRRKSCGKVSRKRPEMRSVTSTAGGRARPRAGSRCPRRARSPRPRPGATPMSASAMAKSSPAVRMVEEPQRSTTRLRGQSPSSCRWRRTQLLGEPDPLRIGAAGRDGAGVDGVEVAPRGQHVRPAAIGRAGGAGGDPAAVERVAEARGAHPRRRRRRRRGPRHGARRRTGPPSRRRRSGRCG